MDLSMGSIVVSIFLGLIGLALLNYGRKEVRVPHMVVGGILLVYPYFVGNWIIILSIAVFLLGGLAVVSHQGY